MWLTLAIALLCSTALAAPQDSRDSYNYENSVDEPINVCSLPVNKGNGSEALPRYYFDEKNGKCKYFPYRGIGGNSNNFVTKEDCMKACAKDPCKITAEYVDREDCKFYDNRTSSCSSDNFCFTTQSQDAGVCCPIDGLTDICFLPQDEGISTGYGKAQRFYYNKATDACEEFTYLGTGGNANHFFNEDDCKEKCVKELTCQIGLPLGFQAGPQSCNAEYECPKGYKCSEDFFCCPLSPRQMVSKQSLEPSSGSAVLPLLYVVLIISLLIC